MTDHLVRMRRQSLSFVDPRLTARPVLRYNEGNPPSVPGLLQYCRASGRRSLAGAVAHPGDREREGNPSGVDWSQTDAPFLGPAWPFRVGPPPAEGGRAGRAPAGGGAG